MTIGAAAFFAVAGAAQAQDCVGGYHMLKGEIPVLCDSGPGQPAFGAPQEESRSPPVLEQLHHLADAL